MNQQYLESLRRTLDRMYSCRDLEISNLWQRSVFLGTFLVLCFTGYGVLVHSILTLNKGTTEQFLQFHFVCCILAVLSVVFSVLWIQMAKASKAWYEVYENYICYFQHEILHGIASLEGEYGNGEYYPGGYKIGNEVKYKLDINNSLFSSKAGGYSPSKINIFIGQICLVLWCTIILVHISLITENLQIWAMDKCCLYCIFGLIVILLIIYLTLILNPEKNVFYKQVRSGFLNNTEVK